MSFPLRCSRFLSQCTRHNFLPVPPASPIPPRPSGSQPRTHTFHDSRAENRWFERKFHCVLWATSLSLKLLRISLTVFTVTSFSFLPFQTERKRKRLRLEDSFLLLPFLLPCSQNFREMTNENMVVVSNQEKD